MSRLGPIKHAFGRGTPFSVGLEEELLLVSPGDLALSHTAAEVVPRLGLPPERAGHEAFLAELELRSEPAETPGGAAGQLDEGRAAARAAGATLLAVGLHPAARFGDVVLTDAPRYARVGEEMRGLIRRTPECALHVHVGIAGPDEACAALTALRERLPLLQGLAASSPFWFGLDSGLASARSALVRGYPGRGAPPPLREWAEYVDELEAVARGGGPSDADGTMVWWDVRLQPRLGTVEMRELDVQSRLDDAAGIAALVSAIARRGVEEPLENPAPGQAVAWSWFSASRDGLDARILHGDGLIPLREATRQLLDDFGGDAPELDAVERILREGNGAMRQRAAFARGGMTGLLELIADETARPLGG